ncbi:MAG: ABC transporter substrate-binding protein [Gemmatimonadaceae bacterium]
MAAIIFAVNLPLPRAARFMALLIALLVGCSGAERSGTATFTVGAGADNSPSGAFQARLGVYPLNANVAETLTHLGTDFQVEPMLATRWENRGSNTWRFHLRQGVFFHDGQPLTARAVSESIARVVRGKGGYSGLGEHSVSVVDDSTVDITPVVANLHLPQQLVHPNYSIFAPGTNPTVHPVGTGPYRWVEYRPYERVVVRRNDLYRGPAGRAEEIIFRFMPDANTRALALLAGELDLAMDFPREQIGDVTRGRQYHVARSTAGQTLTFQINGHGQAPHDLLRDRRLRLAVAHSIDQTRLIRDMWHNEAGQLSAMTIPAILGEYADRVRGISFDTLAAARLLAQAGWRPGPDGIRHRPDGRPLRLEMVASVEVENGAVELLQAQMRRVGIDARFTRVPDPGALSARLTAGDFDLNLALSNQNDADPLFLPALLFYSRSARPFARWYAAGRKFDSIVEAGLATHDPKEMRRLAAEAIRVAVDEEALCIPIAALFRIYALRTDVGGFNPHPSQTNQSWTTLYRSK